MSMTRDDWMKLRLARDFHTGLYNFDTDAVYRYKVQQEELAMVAEELKNKPKPPVVNQNVAERLNTAQAAVNPKTGKRYFEENPKYRENVEKQRVAAYSGQPVAGELFDESVAILAEIDKAGA